MRVLHAVTYVTPDNVFGGPTRVAVELSRELNRRGHKAQLYAPASPALTDTTSWQGVPAHFFRAQTLSRSLGFSGITSPTGMRWLGANVAKYDVVHLHLARDLSTLPAGLIARARGIPVVVQTHGMVDPSDRALSRPLDVVGTKPLLRSARAVLYLTDHERRGLEAVVGGRLDRAAQLRNGVSPTNVRAHPSSSREFVFVSRFEARKRPDYFVRMAAQVIHEGIDATFALIGADQGEAGRVQQLIRELGVSERVRYEGAMGPEQVAARMSQARVLVLPSVDEPFPMVLLEAMAAGLPVICTTSCGLAKSVASLGAGVVVDPDLPSLVDAARRLATDDALLMRLAEGASAAAAGPFGIGGVVDDLLAIYRRAGISTDPGSV